MFKRVRIEKIKDDDVAVLWFFKNTTALKSWLDSGAVDFEVAMSDDTFSIPIGDNDYVYAERIGYELSWHIDNTYDTFNCVTIIKATPVPGEGVTLKAYMGWASKELLQFSAHKAASHNIKVTPVDKDDKIVMSQDDDIEMESTLADAFARALKGVEAQRDEGSSA